MATIHVSTTFTPARRIYALGLRFGLRQASRVNVRGFHATSHRCFIDECLVQTHAFINGLHNLTGLPWAASIPLTAYLTRALVIFPFDCYSRYPRLSMEFDHRASQSGPRHVRCYCDSYRKLSRGGGNALVPKPSASGSISSPAVHAVCHPAYL